MRLVYRVVAATVDSDVVCFSALPTFLPAYLSAPLAVTGEELMLTRVHGRTITVTHEMIALSPGILEIRGAMVLQNTAILDKCLPTHRCEGQWS